MARQMYGTLVHVAWIYLRDGHPRDSAVTLLMAARAWSFGVLGRTWQPTAAERRLQVRAADRMRTGQR